MDHVSDLIASDNRANLPQIGHKSLLRFITCGSVGDGKSTLIGRLLHSSKMFVDDQLAAVNSDRQKWGTQGGDIDFALLVDGLSAERRRGVTSDITYCYFGTDRRKFIVADTPGHEQFTRSMFAGASTADLAVILIDPRRGILTQTRRHSYLAQLVGIRRVVLAVNKMDLVGYDRAAFDRTVVDYRAFAERIGLTDIVAIPLSALKGDNMTSPSAAMPWYQGPTLMQALEEAELDDTRQQQGALRLPVQWVNRPTRDFLGYCGLIASGTLHQGQRIRVQPSGRESYIARIITSQGERPHAVAGESVTVTLSDEVNLSRGDVISAAEAPAEVADQFECTLVWMADAPLLPGRAYLLKIGTRTVGATVTEHKYKVNVNTLEHLAAKQLELNEVGVCNIALDRPVAFDAYADNRSTGGFIVIDRFSNATVGAGMLHFALRRSHNIHLQHLDVDQKARAELKGQKPVVLWFTGLSGAGKSTIANRVESKLLAMGGHSYLLDGDNVRHGLNKDLGFTAVDRVENIRRVAEVASLMVDAGLIVLTAFISPFRAERDLARGLLAEGAFIEVHVDTPLAVAEQRDVKGLYKKARAGQLKNFTGIDSPYEAPEQPELRVDTSTMTVEQAADRVIAMLRERKHIT